MKFILNTALDPHFCALFDAQNILVKKLVWEDRKLDGVSVFDFLKSCNLKNGDLNFVGGVSGPGGFASLRASSSILNALSFTHEIEVSQVRADVWISEYLKDQGFDLPVILNSFSDGVFYINESGNLIRENVEVIAGLFKNQAVFCGTLPDHKSELFVKKVDIYFVDSEIVLLDILKKQKQQDIFLPDYEWPAV